MHLSKYYTDQVYVNADKCLGPIDSHAKVAHIQMGVSENTGKKADLFISLGSNGFLFATPQTLQPWSSDSSNVCHTS